MKETPQENWNRLLSIRTKALERAQTLSKLTNPQLVPEHGVSPDSVLSGPGFSAFCSAGVNSLVSKLTDALFRPGKPFFRLKATDKGIQELSEAAGEEVSRSAIDNMLAARERAAMDEWERKGNRPVLSSVLEGWVITGNVVLLLDSMTEKYRAVHFPNFVIRRTVSGLVSHLVIRDALTYAELDERLQARFKGHTGGDPAFKLHLYSEWYMVGLDSQKQPLYAFRQAIENEVVYEDEDTKGVDEVPWILVTGPRTDGATYGLPLLFPHMADIIAHNKLAEAVVEGSVTATDWFWLVNPAGVTRPEDVTATPRAGVASGTAEDISVAQPGVGTALRDLRELLLDYERRLSQAFLLAVHSIRDSERTTAEEVRMVVNELEKTYAGAYTQIAVQLQAPLARRLLKDAGVTLDDSLEMVVRTGLEALSRNGDLQNLMVYFQTMAQLTNTPPALQERIDIEALSDRVAVLTDADVEGIMQTQQQVDERRQQMMQEQLELQQASLQMEAAATKASK